MDLLSGIRFLMFVTMFSLVCEGNNFYIEIDPHFRGACKYKGYKPGGGKPNIKPIKAPTAKMPANALAEIFGAGKQGTEFAKIALEVTEKFLKAGSALASAAPAIGTALSVLGAALGFISDSLKPGPQDILDQVNKALNELTTEVNDRLAKMKGYVDYKVIELEKRITVKQYRTLFNLYTGCIEGTISRDEILRCVRRAEKQIKASFPKFMILDKRMKGLKPLKKNRSYFTKNKSAAPSYDDVKRIEAGIISFRNYANLHLIVIGSLINSYKDRKGKDRNRYTYYMREQKDKGMSLTFTQNETHLRAVRWDYR